MILYDGFHPVHFEALKMEKIMGKDYSNMGKGDSHKIIIFKNGYGASIMRGFASFGNFELAVLKFVDMQKLPKSRKKRIMKKYYKKVGGYNLKYNTPVTSDVKRYLQESDMIDDLNTISNFKVNQF